MIYKVYSLCGNVESNLFVDLDVLKYCSGVVVLLSIYYGAG